MLSDDQRDRGWPGQLHDRGEKEGIAGRSPGVGFHGLGSALAECPVVGEIAGEVEILAGVEGAEGVAIEAAGLPSHKRQRAGINN